MWNTWLSNSTIPALEQAIAFSQNRHLLLAGNIANLDTPDYKTRDLSVEDFHQQLREAIESENSIGDNSDSIQSPGTRERIHTEMQEVRDVSKQILYHDGSDVSLEHQVTEIAKNQGMHNTAIALIRSQFHKLQAAIQ